MSQQITEGVSITVETFFNKEQSNPVAGEYTFAYRISIDNYADFPVRLLRRHWLIFDSNGTYREVDGEGVVGQQPVLERHDFRFRRTDDAGREHRHRHHAARQQQLLGITYDFVRTSRGRQRQQRGRTSSTTRRSASGM